MKITLFWFRRDLRLEDNVGLTRALQSGHPVLPLFIFDQEILDELPKDDPRFTFIYDSLQAIDQQLRSSGSGLKTVSGKPLKVWKSLTIDYDIDSVYCNHDYEPYAISRDQAVSDFLKEQGIAFHTTKDQVIFEKDEIVKQDGLPYTVFTHYKRKWLSKFDKNMAEPLSLPDMKRFYPLKENLPTLEQLGFIRSKTRVRDYNLSNIRDYTIRRDIPAEEGTSYLGPHLRFGTVSIRQIIRGLKLRDDVFLGELIWREFFMQILFHFPKVVDQNFRPKYDGIEWLNREEEFEKWCQGLTGYPLVDAGMRQLNATGFMHNRVRMATASFLVKHLLIDWRWGEAYFARKLLDYELSSNNGNWQWSAGTGCDAAPYFRVFNPITQQLKFDREMNYIRKWIPELETPLYPQPMIEHATARIRALEAYKKGIRQ